MWGLRGHLTESQLLSKTPGARPACARTSAGPGWAPGHAGWPAAWEPMSPCCGAGASLRRPHIPPGWVAEEVGGASQGLGEWGRAGLGTLIPERPPPGSGAHGRCGAGLPAPRLGARPHRGPPALGVRCVPARSWVTGGCGWCWPRDAFPCPGVALRSDWQRLWGHSYPAAAW